MPTISSFYGIVIRMFFNDHPPPHFHALYGEFQATTEIEGLRILEGELPRRALELVLEWAWLHKAELLEGWERCANTSILTRLNRSPSLSDDGKGVFRTMRWHVVEVTPEPGWLLTVRFADGLTGTVRFEPGYFTGVLEPLRDPQFFDRVFVGRGAVAWPGDIDLAPDAMYREIQDHGEWVLSSPLRDAMA